jgi:hypothetical protein
MKRSAGKGRLCQSSGDKLAILLPTRRAGKRSESASGSERKGYLEKLSSKQRERSL